MKRIIKGSLLGLAAAGMVATAYGQGYVLFANYYGSEAAITNGVTGDPLDNTFTAGLYYVLGTATEPADTSHTAMPVNVTNLWSGSQAFSGTLCTRRVIRWARL